MLSILPHIEGYAIVSADGMIATGRREMPPSIRNDADQHFFQDALDRAAVVVHGRHSHEGGPRAGGRKRLLLTRRRVAALGPDAAHPHSLLWNPAGASLDEALARLGINNGLVAIIGGPDVFSLFLPQYDAFHLSRAPHARIPGGLPVFNEVGPNAAPEDVLSRHGLKPGPRRDLDPAAGVSVVTWQRKAER